MKKIKISSEEVLKKYKEQNWEFYLGDNEKSKETFSSILEKSLDLPSTTSLNRFFKNNGDFYYYKEFQEIKQSPLSNYTGRLIFSKEICKEKIIVCRTLHEWNGSFTGGKIIYIAYYKANDKKLTKAYALEADDDFKDLKDFTIHTLSPKVSKKYTKPVGVFTGSKIDSSNLVIRLLPSILSLYKKQLLPKSLIEPLEKFKQNKKKKILEEIIKNL